MAASGRATQTRWEVSQAVQSARGRPSGLQLALSGMICPLPQTAHLCFGQVWAPWPVPGRGARVPRRQSSFVLLIALHESPSLMELTSPSSLLSCGGVPCMRAYRLVLPPSEPVPLSDSLPHRFFKLSYVSLFLFVFVLLLFFILWIFDKIVTNKKKGNGL